MINTKVYEVLYVAVRWCRRSREESGRRRRSARVTGEQAREKRRAERTRAAIKTLLESEESEAPTGFSSWTAGIAARRGRV